MSTIPLKREKRQGLINPVFVLVCVLLIGALVLPGSLTTDIYNSISRVLGTPGNVSVATGSGDTSFALDEQYWDANCSHGWASDATCDAIVSRAQSCVASIALAYCSDYENYMKQFHNQLNNIYFENL